eukprot:13958854-Ditylum_brightwellii.AAC.1
MRGTAMADASLDGQSLPSMGKISAQSCHTHHTQHMHHTDHSSMSLAGAALSWSFLITTITREGDIFFVLCIDNGITMDKKFDERRSVCDVDGVEAALPLLLGVEEGKSSCGDGAASECDDSCKLAEWLV